MPVGAQPPTVIILLSCFKNGSFEKFRKEKKKKQVSSKVPTPTAALLFCMNRELIFDLIQSMHSHEVKALSFIAPQWEQLDGIKFSSWQQASALSSVKFHCDLQRDTMALQHPACTALPIKWQRLSEKNLANWYEDMCLLYVWFV